MEPGRKERCTAPATCFEVLFVLAPPYKAWEPLAGGAVELFHCVCKFKTARSRQDAIP